MGPVQSLPTGPSAEWGPPRLRSRPWDCGTTGSPFTRGGQLQKVAQMAGVFRAAWPRVRPSWMAVPRCPAPPLSPVCPCSSRPPGSSYFRYAESSMKNSFGLKYLHKFFNIPFLQLQVSLPAGGDSQLPSLRRQFGS